MTGTQPGTTGAASAARAASAAMAASALALVAAAAGCDEVVNLDDGAIDGTLIVFDAGDAPTALPDASFDPSDCAMELPCPPPTDGRATVCGRLWDMETDQVLRAANPTGAACGTAADGPCSLSVRFFDALDFAQDPMNAQPLPAESVVVDDCGRYRGQNLTRATFGFIGVAVDDAAGTADRHALTAVVTSNGLATPHAGFRAYLTRRTTDEAWSGGPGAPTFSARGALVNVFTYHDVPRAGVQIRRNGVAVPADETFGFADPGVSRAMIAPQQETTGPNGTVVLLNSPTPIAHDAVGGEPPGCIWPSNLGASTPGVILMQRKEAQTPGGAPCP